MMMCLLQQHSQRLPTDKACVASAFQKANLDPPRYTNLPRGVSTYKATAELWNGHVVESIGRFRTSKVIELEHTVVCMATSCLRAFCSTPRAWFRECDSVLTPNNGCWVYERVRFSCNTRWCARRRHVTRARERFAAHPARGFSKKVAAFLH
jgi:hypothetical protein